MKVLEERFGQKPTYPYRIQDIPGMELVNGCYEKDRNTALDTVLLMYS